MMLFPMAIITLFWKDCIGLSLTQILLLQGILSVVMVVMEYPSGYVSDRIGYRAALNIASLLGMAGLGALLGGRHLRPCHGRRNPSGHIARLHQRLGQRPACMKP